MFLTIVIAILIFGLLIIAHEFGHFITAVKSGVTVEEFSAGMGPLLFQKETKITKFSLRLLPIGGYCRMKGEDGEDYEEGSFNSAKAWKRILILFSGSAMNFIIAILIFFVIFMMVGTATNSTVITGFSDNSPAYNAGIEAGDTIISIDGDSIQTWDQITEKIENSNGNPLYVGTEKKDGSVEYYSIQPYLNEEQGVYKFGITPEYKPNIFASIKNAFGFFWMYIKLIFGIFIGIFRGEFQLSSLTGPIGATAILNEYIPQGMIYVLNIAAAISVSLGFFNLLPIPALDGSRVVFVIIEKIKGSPINKQTEGKIHLIGFAALLVLGVVIAYQDIVNLL